MRGDYLDDANMAVGFSAWLVWVPLPVTPLTADPRARVSLPLVLWPPGTERDMRLWADQPLRLDSVK